MVDAACARIARDDRHANINQLASGSIDKRMFGEWDMLHDPAKSWLWSIEEVADSALDRAIPDEARTVFATLAENVETGVA